MSAPRASKPRPDDRRNAGEAQAAAPGAGAGRPGAFARAEVDLPEGCLPCVWMSAGLVAYKLCEREYECDGCPLDAALGGPHPWAELRGAGRARFDVRGDRRYSRSHVWVRALGRTRVRCGVDAFAGRLLDQVSAVVLPAVGTLMRRGEPACWLVDDGEPIAIASPLDGTVVRANDDARREPARVASQPYDDGWLFDLEVAAADAPDAQLLDVRAARLDTARDLRSLRRHVAHRARAAQRRVGPTLRDGGVPIARPRGFLGRDAYHRLVQHFLR
jgi:glycine cleavage system H protein